MSGFFVLFCFPFFFEGGHFQIVKKQPTIGERIQMRSSPTTAWLWLWVWTGLQKWSFGLWVVIWSVLWNHVVEQWLKLPPLPPRDSSAKAGVWALVSWLFGAFTRHIFWLIEIRPGLNSRTVCYIKLGLGSRLRVVLWEEILPGDVLLYRTLWNSTYYSGQDGQISKGEQEEKRIWRHVSSSAWRTLRGPQREREKKEKNILYCNDSARNLDGWWIGWGGENGEMARGCDSAAR